MRLVFARHGRTEGNVIKVGALLGEGVETRYVATRGW